MIRTGPTTKLAMRIPRVMLPVAGFLAALAGTGQGAEPQAAFLPQSRAVQSTAESRQAYTQFALDHQGDPARGWSVFTNAQAAACVRCHTTDGSSARVGPDLFAISDKFSRRDLIRSVLEPSATIAVGYDTTILETKSDEEYQGVIKQATEAWIELMGWDGKTFRVATSDVVARRTGGASFMPSGMETVMTPEEFADLIAYLQTLHQPASA